MLGPSHDTDGRVQLQALSLVGDAWATAVGPRLPADLAAPARALKALQRVRGRGTPPDLWRGVVASGVGPLATRRLGAWAVLSGLADRAEAAWRQRRRARHAWRRGLRGAWRAAPEAPALPWPRPAGRLVPAAASPPGQPGGSGDDGRVPPAHACPVGRR